MKGAVVSIAVGMVAAVAFFTLPSGGAVSLYTPSFWLAAGGSLMLAFGRPKAAGVCYAVMGLGGAAIALSIGVAADGDPWRMDTAAEAAVQAAQGRLPMTLFGILTHLPFGIAGLWLLLRTDGLVGSRSDGSLIRQPAAAGGVDRPPEAWAQGHGGAGGGRESMGGFRRSENPYHLIRRPIWRAVDRGDGRCRIGASRGVAAH